MGWKATMGFVCIQFRILRRGGFRISRVGGGVGLVVRLDRVWVRP